MRMDIQNGRNTDTCWVSTWACAQQLTEPANLPPLPGLAGNTLRQVVHVSIGGSSLRVQFSNEYGEIPLVLTSVHLAVSAGADAIAPATDRALTFAGSASVMIAAGQTAFSDTVNFDLPAQANLAVSILFGSTPSRVTGHPGSRTTSYLQQGNAVLTPGLAHAVATEHWYILSRIDVQADNGYAALVALGDSITDGRGSTTDGHDRWPDNLSARLQSRAATRKVAVLNMGIGGNAVITGGLGPTALERFDRDVPGHCAVRWLIILEGVNDIGGACSRAVAGSLIEAYGQFIEKAHNAGIRVYGVPILPFGGSFYDTVDHEAARQTVNDWIRTGGGFDAVIDLDAAVRDPAHPSCLLAAYDCGDHLHLSAAGYRKMADAIALELFDASL